jgi:hypothetical protein
MSGARHTRRPELVELIPELKEVRRATEALQALKAEWAVWGLLSPSSRTLLSGMPNGGQTGDQCVRLTFPRMGLAGEGSVGRRIVMM